MNLLACPLEEYDLLLLGDKVHRGFICLEVDAPSLPELSIGSERAVEPTDSVISSVVLTPVFRKGSRRPSLEFPSGTKSARLLSLGKYVSLPE